MAPEVRDIIFPGTSLAEAVANEFNQARGNLADVRPPPGASPRPIPPDIDPNLQVPHYTEEVFEENRPWFRAPTEGRRAFDAMEAFLRNPPSRSGQIEKERGETIQPGVGVETGEQIIDDKMGMTGEDNPLAQFLGEFLTNRPDISAEPGLGPYFENAQRRALERINQEAAARGHYGTSAAHEIGAQAIADLQGQQALMEADYNLKRLGEQRMWEGLAGQLAGSTAESQLNWADTLSRIGINVEGMEFGKGMAGIDVLRQLDDADIDKVKTFIASALNIDAGELDKIAAYGGASGDAETAGVARSQLPWQNMYDLLDLLLPLAANATAGGFNYDEGLLGSTTAAGTGAGAAGATGTRNLTEDLSRGGATTLQVADLVKDWWGG
jgi:hypothetical protein